MSEREWITAVEAADLLKITPWEVYRYGVAGRIKTRRIGGHVYYMTLDIARLAGDLWDAPSASAVAAGDPAIEVMQLFREASAAIDALRESHDRQSEWLDRLRDQLDGDSPPLSRRVLPGLIVLGLTMLLLMATVLALAFATL